MSSKTRIISAMLLLLIASPLILPLVGAGLPGYPAWQIEKTVCGPSQRLVGYTSQSSAVVLQCHEANTPKANTWPSATRQYVLIQPHDRFMPRQFRHLCPAGYTVRDRDGEPACSFE